MNIDRLIELRDHVLQPMLEDNPARVLDLSNWTDSKNCPLCVIGHAMHHPPFNEAGFSCGWNYPHVQDDNGDDRNGWNAVSLFFDIDTPLAMFLFSQIHYPAWRNGLIPVDSIIERLNHIMDKGTIDV